MKAQLQRRWGGTDMPSNEQRFTHNPPANALALDSSAFDKCHYLVIRGQKMQSVSN